MSNGDAIRERELYTRNRDLALRETLDKVKKELPKESSLAGNQSPCTLKGPKKKNL